MKASLRTLLDSAVDYAGTFPPALLDLAAALREYAEHRAGPHAWMLGSFVLAAGKIEEFEDLARAVLPPPGAAPWPLTVILADVGADLERAGSLARRWRGRARVDAVEAPPLEPSRIGPAAARVPAGAAAFFEVPVRDPEAHLAAVGAAGASAKVRTGGTKAEAFPGAMELSAFLAACARARIPFKATAGLHHPFRSARALDGAGPVDMHGFVNLAAAASLLRAGKIGGERVPAVLEERSPAAFRFGEEGLSWKDARLANAEIAEARRGFFRSFGSCSFREPAAELEECGP